MEIGTYVLVAIVVMVLIFVKMTIVIIPQSETKIIERLGRYYATLKPGINILLVDYHRLIIYDELLPAGRLREPVKSKNRADIVIVTKCPTDLKPMDFRVITKALNLFPYQQLYFSTHKYESLQPVFNRSDKNISKRIEALSDENVLLVTGIASPEQMKLDLQPYAKRIEPLAFDDHHQFTAKDVARINEAFKALPSPKLIVTTEKDVTRLKDMDGLSDEVRQQLYVLPIYITLMQDQEEAFNKNILGYVRKNSRNSILVRDKDDHKAQDSDSSGDRPRTISFRNN